MKKTAYEFMQILDYVMFGDKEDKVREIIDRWEKDPCDVCGYAEGSLYCREHCPYEVRE